MLKKIISLILAFVSFSVFANTKNEFNNLLNDFNYSLVVEWDQKDQDFLKTQMAGFQQKLAALKDAGLSNQEVTEVLKQRSLSPETVAQIETLILAGKFQTNDDILNFMKHNQNAFSMNGASWNGETTFFVAFAAGLILVITAIVLVLSDASKEYICTEYSTTQSCSMDSWCMTYDPNDSNSCISWSSPQEYCSYPCVAGYWED